MALRTHNGQRIMVSASPLCPSASARNLAFESQRISQIAEASDRKRNADEQHMTTRRGRGRGSCCECGGAQDRACECSDQRRDSAAHGRSGEGVCVGNSGA